MRHRLIGAYQGIALPWPADGATLRHRARCARLVCRYERRPVILRPLKDGYYLVLALAPTANLGKRCTGPRSARRRMDLEL